MGGWVSPNTYVCLHGGWVGVARCLRNQKITEEISSENEHLENEKRKNALYQDQKYFFVLYCALWGCSDLRGQHGI